MVLIPGVGAIHRTLWVAHTVSLSRPLRAPNGIVVSLAAFSPTDLSLRVTQEVHVVGSFSKLGSLHACRTALAFGFNSCTCVFRLAGPCVGPLLFKAEGLCRAQLNADGCFMAGLCVASDPHAVKVLDATNGRCLATVSHSDLSVGTQSACELTVLGAVWCSDGQLLIRSALEDRDERLYYDDRFVAGWACSEVQFC